VTNEDLLRAALAADDRFQAALEAAYGRRAGDMRYAKDLPDHLMELRRAKRAADAARWGTK
jgi:hypothetical protein